MFTAYLNLNGQGREAAALYAEAFQGEVAQLRLYSDLPADRSAGISDEARALVMHAHLKTPFGDIMLSDRMSGSAVYPTSAIWLNALSADQAQLRHAFEVLSREGEVLEELTSSFHTPLVGQVKDKFGFYWTVRAV